MAFDGSRIIGIAPGSIPRRASHQIAGYSKLAGSARIASLSDGDTWRASTA